MDTGFKIATIGLILFVTFAVGFIAYAAIGSYSATNQVDKMDCDQLRQYILYGQEHKYDFSVITANSYATQRLSAICLH